MDNTNDLSNQQLAILPSSETEISVGHAPSLLKRGLDALEQLTVTEQQIQKTRDTTREYRGLSDSAIKMILERPSHWEYRLFFLILLAQITAIETVSQNIELGYTRNKPESLTFNRTVNWLQSRDKDYANLLESINSIGKEFQIAVGLPGVSGEPIAITIAARKFAMVFKDSMELSERLNSVKYDPIFRGIFTASSKAFQELALDIKRYCLSSMASLKDITETLEKPRDTAQPIELTLTLTITPMLGDVIEEFESLTTRLNALEQSYEGKTRNR